MAERKVAFVTGIGGQDGSFLAELLLEKGYQVWGLVRRSSTFNRERIEHLHDFQQREEDLSLKLVYGDLTDGNSLERAVSRIRPSVVYNLGAQSHVRISFDNPVYTVDTNALGTLRLLEACCGLYPMPRFYQASSSEMFGSSPPPQSEMTFFHPRSPYACAKVYAFHQVVNYREAYGIFCCNGILFNHASERRGENFVLRKITRAAARIKLGLQDKLYLGNLEAKRDVGHALDYTKAMILMMEADEPDDYVIATGETRSIKEFLDAVFDRLDLDWQQYVGIDKRYYRPTEVNVLCGDASKARDKLGWEPSVNFGELVDLMLKHDLKLAQKERLVRDAKEFGSDG